MKKENDVKINKHFKEETIILQDFHSRDVVEQDQLLINVLKKIYVNEEQILRSWVSECFKLACNLNDAKISLPKITVEKKQGNLIFRVVEKKKKGLLLPIYILIFLAVSVLAAYWGLYFYNNMFMGKDIDGDGVPDINLYTRKDKKNGINIDLDGDNKPDLNIDYKQNRKATFNIDKDGDGKPDFNMVNDATNGKVCKINCDTNGDGWPDLNIDLDGDGKPDVDIDTDGDGVPDMNIDINGDGKCNLMCDTNSDGKCDKYCIGIDTKYIKPVTSSGNGTTEIKNKESFGLILTYSSDNLTTHDVYPDDMAQAKPIPDKKFTIENTSNTPIIYRLVWKIYQNDFQTDNLKYKLSGTNGGITTTEASVPKKSGLIASYITIPPKTTQEYTLSFRLEGINAEQNIDQNKTFSGIVKVENDY